MVSFESGPKKSISVGVIDLVGQVLIAEIVNRRLLQLNTAFVLETERSLILRC